MNRQFIVAALLIGLLANIFAVEVKLADASASASVMLSSQRSKYTISIEFLPVTTLDEISNREMSETIAQFYAEEALSGFLHEPKAIVFSKVQSTLNVIGGSKAQCVFDVPVEAVIDAPVRKVEVREEVVGKRHANKSIDASAHLLDFRSSCFRDLRIAESLYSEQIGSLKERKERNALRRRICDAFSSLRQKINEDDDLFRAEKKELIEKANKVERYLLGEIDGEGARSEKSINVPIKDAVFKEPYGSLLKTDVVLLTRGGARFVEIGDGAIAILAVGSAMADNDDMEEVAEMMASAELGKLQAGEEVVVANKRERIYSRLSDSNGESEKLDVRRTSMTAINSMDFHKCGETVGTWFSSDGKRFFMAKGRIVYPKSKE